MMSESQLVCDYALVYLEPARDLRGTVSEGGENLA